MSAASFSVRRPVATTMLLAFMIIMGLFSYVQIPVDLFPRIEMPTITVLTVYPGASPEEIENLVTDKIEETVSSISGIDTLTSNSLEGLSQVIIKFENEVDQDTAAQDVRSKLDLILADLPSDAEKPVILKLDINATSVIDLAVYGTASTSEINDYVDNTLKDQLAKVYGVADVSLTGYREREIRIFIDEDRLGAYRMSLVQIADFLRQQSLELPGGRIINKGNELTVRFAGKFASVRQIKDLEIPIYDGHVIKLKEVAAVTDTFEEERERAFFNGQQAVLLSVKKRSDANATEVAAAVRNEVKRLQSRLNKNINIGLVKDRSIFILDSLDEVTSNLYVGIILTGIILYIFLHSIRVTFIAAMAMPSAIIATMLLVFASGFTLNMLTLMALSITVGILVNNAIVVLENVVNKINSGLSPKEAAVIGTDEIAIAVIGATLTNVVVFVPLAFMDGIVGQFFLSFGMTAAFATIISLIISFSMTPMLAAYVIKGKENEDSMSIIPRMFNKGYKWIEAEYKRELPVIFKHPLLVLFSSVALLIMVFIVIGPHVGFEFMAETDQGEFIVKIRKPSGSSLDSTTKLIKSVEEIIYAKVPELKRVAIKVGKIDALIGASEGVELGQLTGFVGNKNLRERSIRDILVTLRAPLAKLKDCAISIEVPGTIGATGPPMQVEILGSTFESLEPYSKKIQHLMKTINGAVDVDTTWLPGRPEIRIIPDRVRCQRAGVSIAYFATSIRGRFTGLTPVTYREGSNEYDVRLILADNRRNDLSSVRKMKITLPNGKSVALQDLADIERKRGFSRIVRKDRRKTIIVTCYVKGRSYGSVLSDIQKAQGALDSDGDIEVRYMGDAERMRDTSAEIKKAFILAILLTYMLLGALLESFIYPIIILISLPLSFAGILPALFICNMNIAMFPLMAVVMLVGIVVNNGILIIENITLYRNRGETMEHAVIDACPERLRPILMTTIAAAVAMIPLALGQGSGGEMRAPMAVVSIGGLLVSMMLSIYIIPLLYHLYEGWFHNTFRDYSDKIRKMFNK